MGFFSYGDQYIPPMLPAAAAAAASAAGSGLSTTRDSVVRMQAQMLAAFSRAERVTLVGSTMPLALTHRPIFPFLGIAKWQTICYYTIRSFTRVLPSFADTLRKSINSSCFRLRSMCNHHHIAIGDLALHLLKYRFLRASQV